jgi:hypothetical protein
MEHSMAAAYRVIAQLPAGQAASVRGAVDHAFLGGMRVGSLVCAGIALMAAILVAALLPARSVTFTSTAHQQVPSKPSHR